VRFYSYYPIFSFYHSEVFGGPANIHSFGLKLKNRGEYYAQAAKYLNDLEPGATDNFTLVYHAERKETFGYFYLGTPLIGNKHLPKGRFLDYLVVEQPSLNTWMYEKCKLKKTFGPRYPFKYD
jgi:hypothetical protein